MPRAATRARKNTKNKTYQRPNAGTRGTSDETPGLSSDATLHPRSSFESDTGENDENERPAQLQRRRRLNADPMTTEKGRTKRNSSKDAHHSRVLQLAQFIKRNVNLFIHVPSVMNYGLAYDTVEDYRLRNLRPGDNDYDEEEIETVREIVDNCSGYQEIFTKAYNGIRNLLKEEWDFICALEDEEEEQLWREVKDQANQGRCNDKSTLKIHAHKIILKVGILDVDVDDREKFGTAHPELLRMIVPMSILHKYGNDPTFEKDVQDKKYKMNHLSFPAFLFDVDNYNPKSPKETLLRGYLPVRVLKHIYTSPGSASATTKERKGTRECNAEIAGIKEVSPEMIAYACVHVYMMISKMKQWGEVDRGFNVKKFYYEILELFKNRRAKWTRETLEWLTRQVFHLRDPQVDEQEVSDPNDEASFANILAAINNDEDEDDASSASDDAAVSCSKAAAPAAPRTRGQTQATETQADSQYSNAFAEHQTN